MRKRLKQLALLVLRDPDSRVAHRHAQVDVAGSLVGNRPGFHPQQDFAFVRELECVADKVGQHLPEAQGIANQPVGHRRERVRDELDVLLDHRRPERLGDFLEHVPDAEGRLLDLQLVRFDLREVEDVVEDAEQVARR